MCILFISKGIEKSELKKNTFKSETNNSIYIYIYACGGKHLNTS